MTDKTPQELFDLAHETLDGDDIDRYIQYPETRQQQGDFAEAMVYSEQSAHLITDKLVKDGIMVERPVVT